ncbi:MAG: hypothetical protein Q7U54_15530 [Bacteroidales bacterium]|nr:hypothetical protein [Bacteroidales bacterium]
MKQILLMNFRLHIFILSFLLVSYSLSAQSFNLGWSGTELVPKVTFLNPSNWTTNVASASLGDKSVVYVSADTLKLNWTFGTGERTKWSQCYLPLTQTISLVDYDLFGFDLKGLPNNGYVGFELKFEDGSYQAVARWDGLAGLNRWAEKITVAKKQFENSALIDWSKIRVVSLAVYAQASAAYVTTDLGSVSIHNLVGTKMADWQRGTSREFINPNDFISIKENAIQAIINRQKSTGLLTTWSEDNSSWLYGQGLALKALCNEGTWSQGIADNAAAMAAEKLAVFLLNHQQPEGYWPRAWNSVSGAITVLREADGTVWMGDFPWIITGLQAYYKKSGDQRVIPSINMALGFLKGLINPDGNFFTVNPQTGIKNEVASCEAYAAAILSLYESGETELAGDMFSFISTHGWDSELRCWREATYSDRIVLFANTWMSYYNFQNGDTQKGLDALSLAGKVLYTHGNGELYGMDGIVPLAVWYEGTLTYIAAGGPGSISLFEELRPHINSDGMVSHYNENLGGMGGIWAVDWHSLDGTSWLYFTTAGKSPFDVLDGIPVSLQPLQAAENKKNFIVSVPRSGELLIKPINPIQKEMVIRVIQSDGRILSESKVPAHSGDITLALSPENTAGRVVFIQFISNGQIECYPIYLY